MKYVKMFGLAIVAAVSLMAFVGAGTASATTLTGNNCAAHCATGTTIAAESEGAVTLHPPIGEIICNKSSVSGKTSTTGSETETVKGNIEALSFSECNATVTVLSKGTLEIHTRIASTNENGTLTSSGAEVTVVFAGFHCIFKTTNTDLGVVTGSSNTSGNATLDIEATIPRTGGSSGIFCGSTAQWTGAYKITNPSTLNVH